MEWVFLKVKELKMNNFIINYVFIVVFVFLEVRARLILSGFPSKYNEYIGIESVSGKAIFTCDVESDSPFELKWYRNGIEFNFTTGPPWLIKHPGESGVSVYLWPFSHPRAQGVYECKASNGIDVSLTRKIKYISKPAQLLTNEFPKGPKFQKLPYGNIYVGGNITLYCNASGKGVNEISWFLNLIPISKQSNAFKYQLSNGNTTLVLYDLGFLKNAAISCYVANAVGIQQMDEMFFSTIQPTLPPTNAPPPGSAPIITVKPANISVDGPEQTIDFDCQATGQPAPKFSWKGPKGYIKQKVDDGKLQLYVMESGSVTCFAENYEGVDAATAYFDVKPTPFRPYEVKSVPDEMTQTSFSFVIYPNPAENDYHSKIPITYAVLETKPYTGLEKQYVSGLNLIKVNIDGKAPWKHTIKELLPWTQLYMRVRLGNLYGLGNPSKWSEFYTKMAPLDLPVQNLKNVALSKKSFTLSWEDPERLNGKISHYEVSLRFEPTIRWLTYKVYDYQKYYKYDWEGNDEFHFGSPIVHWKVQIVGLDGLGPISQEKVFRVAIGAPGFVTNLSVIAFGSRHVRLYWNSTDDVGSGIIAYNIEWRKKNSLNEWQILKSQVVTDNWVDVKDLKPNQEYEFRVIPESSTSLGVPSKTASAKTLTDSPTAPPQYVRGFATRAESIEVFWEEPELDHQNGNITGYKVYFTRKIGRKPLFLTAGGNARSIYIQGLSKFTQYSVWVVAFNEKGDSPPSPIFELYTKEKVPEGAPQSVQAQALNDTFIAVTWLPPLLSLQNGRIFGYKIYYRKHKDTAEFGEEYYIKLYGESLKDAVLHESISADQDYRINVAAFTALGDGFKSANIYLKTPPNLPSAPSVQSEIDYTTNKVTLIWRPATNFVEYYKIEYGKSLRKYDMLSHKKGKLVASDIRKSLFDDLDSGVWYCFMVSGDLGKHDGWTATSIVWERTSDGVPSSPPLYFEGITESSSSIKLQWEKPDPWKRNGIIIGYYIDYKSFDERRWRNIRYQTSENDVETFLLTDLTASTRYKIRVQAFTQVGNGPFSEEIQVMTSQEVLPIVSKLRVLEVETTSAYIHWSDPVNTMKFKSNLKFIIIYTAQKLYRTSNGIVDSFRYNKTITIFAKQLQLSELLPCTTYEVFVKVETEEAGTGDPVTTNFTTVCKAPTDVPVPYLNTSVQDSNIIPLQIYPASNIHGLIDHYELFVIDVKNSSVLSSSIKSTNFASAKDHRSRRHINNNTESSIKPDFYVAAMFTDDELPKLFKLGDGSNDNRKLIGGHYYSTFLRAYVKISTDIFHTDSELSKPIRFGPTTDVSRSKLPEDKNSSSFIIIGAASAGGLFLLLAVGFLVLLWKRNHRPIYSGEDSKLLKKKSKRSFRNPKNLADPTEVHRLHCNTPGMISHPPINIETLSKHVKNLKLDNGIKFIQEFESIQSSEKYSSEVARLNINLSKNRYPNVVAYDETRVKLECPSHNSSDYINANYIDGYCKQKAYIATQGPMKNTINDFWLLCWEQNVQVIVMVTKLEERGRSKCEQYWPDHGSEIYGSIRVEFKSELKLCNDCIRTFEISSTVNGEVRTVKHYQYLQWPDPGVPSCPGPVLAFVRRVHSFEPPGCGPTVVHCSAGVGRSACYIAIDAMLERIKYDNMIDIYGYVNMMRSQRNFMVQTDEQYMFVYDVLVEAIECGVTELTSREFSAEFKQLTALLNNGRETLLETQFKSLSTVDEYDSSAMTAAYANDHKNRSKVIVPFDSNRVQLQPLRSHEGSDYINASYIDGYYRPSQFIATQGPSEKTAADFWRMIMDINCTIVVMVTNLDDKDGHEQCYQYWPNSKSMNHHLYVIDPINENRFANFIIREFKVSDIKNDVIRNIRQYHYLNWPIGRVPDSSESFIEFIGHVQKASDKFSPLSPIVVHSSLGAGRTGVFITLSIALESLRNEDKVDIYQIVKSLRHQRTYMVESLEQYEFCYKVVFDFLKNFDFIA
ncbi:receptor-type tyrosine-protein phosphatase delta isoform X1 [Hydra vulgaris]|uniref:receptor-type tyrosine-protein phosphatase delta isoform X1 n=1 Tax=Hydra vulgaris TaxID=6087 RepID=UPI001F5ED382|nr:receptor-type tyrosine-protein phosphatase delta [Hydra vulgaris]